MQNFLNRPESQRKTIYEQIALRVGVSDPRAIEKDMWVSSLLQVVFSLPYADKFVFKGGSSLSKIWKLIHRFSEDIDLAIDRSMFGLEGDLTKKQLKKLRKESSLFVKDRLSADISELLAKYGIDEYCDVISEPDGEGDGTYPEPRKIHIAYNSVFDAGDGYLRPEVLLEVGARSLFEPTSKAAVQSMISENSEIKTDETIRHHREVFTSIRGVDYTPDVRKRLVLVPPKEFETEWRRDYETMQKTMIYGDEMPYDKLISRISQLQEQFRQA